MKIKTRVNSDNFDSALAYEACRDLHSKLSEDLLRKFDIYDNKSVYVPSPGDPWNRKIHKLMRAKIKYGF